MAQAIHYGRLLVCSRISDKYQNLGIRGSYMSPTAKNVDFVRLCCLLRQKEGTQFTRKPFYIVGIGVHRFR